MRMLADGWAKQVLLVLTLAAPIVAQTPAKPSQSNPETLHRQPALPDVLPKTPVSNDERASISISAYDLDLHLVPAEAREEVHAHLVLHNTSTTPLLRIPLQISSTLRWQGVSLATNSDLKSVPFTQSPVATDADHTGYAQEVVITLSRPLAVGASLTLSVFYAGEIRPSAARLELLGTPVERAAEREWDSIAPTTDSSATALRGFGNVLWYPVAAPVAVLGDANKLFELIAQQRLLNVTVSLRLRLTVEYIGEPPEAALFNSQAQPLIRTPDLGDQLVGDTRGVATAEFAAIPIGFRTPSLFLTAQHAVATPGELLSVITPDPEAIPIYTAAASKVQPLLGNWLGATPLTPLILLDHRGQSFEDAALLVTQLSPSAKPDGIATELIRGLSHAWFRAPAPTSLWLDQGVPEFMSLLWLERTVGREAALGQLQHASLLIALAEPDPEARPQSSGQPLVHTGADVFLRLKSAAVLWQLREMLGEELFRKALSGFRRSLALQAGFDRDATAFQRSIEHTAGRDLTWFFDDWVYHDRGLPDLTIVQVNPRLLPARPGKNSGYLVAVEVRNDGGSIAEVPVTVRSGSLTSMERLRIAAHASSSTRILFEGTPESVQVNDGSTPELRTTLHVTSVPTQAHP